MSITSWFKGHGIGGNSSEPAETLMEDSEPDYSQMTPEQIERRERVVHRVRKLDRLALDLERVDHRKKQMTPVGLGAEDRSEVVWPKPNAGYDPTAFRSCVPSVPFEAQRLDQDFVVRTRTGPTRGRAGDYLVRMPNGDMCIFAASVFEQLFRFIDG